MIVTTGNEVAGYAISEYLGIIRGIVVRSPNIAQGFLGGLKQMVGGNIESFAAVCETAREHAYERHGTACRGARCRCRHRDALRCHGIQHRSNGSSGVWNGREIKNRLRWPNRPV